MFLTKEGVTERFLQYECSNLTQVKNTINEITKTKTVNCDWKDFCYAVKQNGGSDSCDYIYFDDNDKEQDCSVFIGYDSNTKCYILWIEV